MKLRTCVHPDGKFICGAHRPRFQAENLRENDYVESLGNFDGRPLLNTDNFPSALREDKEGDWVYEVPNPFPFRGTTYIARKWAEDKAADPTSIALPRPQLLSFSDTLQKWFGGKNLSSEKLDEIFSSMPEPLSLALATTCSDRNDLARLAELCCEFVCDPQTGRPSGLMYDKDARGRVRPRVKNEALYEALANNIFLPDEYKKAMVLKPGAQGDSPVVGEWLKPGESHVFEYLRSNSYIPWGHFAANMAHTAVRYRISQLSPEDMTGLRHLYYQRTYVRIAERLGLETNVKRRTLSSEQLEDLRLKINRALKSKNRKKKLKFTRSLWGWNFGFDFAPSRYRLHASHQQIHQQFALVPASVPLVGDACKDGDQERNAESGEENMESYACGDLIADFIKEYRRQTGENFFDCYIKAIQNNTRIDQRTDKPADLTVYKDQQAMIFVPKAQTSQWELQLVALSPIGNILEADINARRSLDRAMLIAVKILEALGAGMITSIEFSKAFVSSDTDQRLLYSFLPKLPESPGAFSEAQLRWINGHYPEDFARACRSKLPLALKDTKHGGNF